MRGLFLFSIFLFTFTRVPFLNEKIKKRKKNSNVAFFPQMHTNGIDKWVQYSNKINSYIENSSVIKVTQFFLSTGVHKQPQLFLIPLAADARTPQLCHLPVQRWVQDRWDTNTTLYYYYYYYYYYYCCCCENIMTRTLYNTTK